MKVLGGECSKFDKISLDHLLWQLEPGWFPITVIKLKAGPSQ